MNAIVIFSFVCCLEFSNGFSEKVYLTSGGKENIFEELQKLKLRFDVMQNEMDILKEQQRKDKQEIKVLKKRDERFKPEAHCREIRNKRIERILNFLEERKHVNGQKDEFRPASNLSSEVHPQAIVFTHREQKKNPSSKQTVVNFAKRGSTGNGTHKVAFHVTLKQRLGHLGLNQPIPFDDIKTNIGATYNTNTGIFTCSVPGTYVFFSMMKFNQGHSAIVKNGSVYSIMGHESSDDFETSSGMAVMNLNVGDAVWVKTVTESAHDEDIGHYSTFTGFLLYPDLE